MQKFIKTHSGWNFLQGFQKFLSHVHLCDQKSQKIEQFKKYKKIHWTVSSSLQTQMLPWCIEKSVPTWSRGPCSSLTKDGRWRILPMFLVLFNFDINSYTEMIVGGLWVNLRLDWLVRITPRMLQFWLSVLGLGRTTALLRHGIIIIFRCWVFIILKVWMLGVLPFLYRDQLLTITWRRFMLCYLLHELHRWRHITFAANMILWLVLGRFVWASWIGVFMCLWVLTV